MKRKRTPSSKDIVELENQVASQLDKMEATFIKQLAELRELLQSLSFKRALMSSSSEAVNAVESE